MSNEQIVAMQKTHGQLSYLGLKNGSNMDKKLLLKFQLLRMKGSVEIRADARGVLIAYSPLPDEIENKIQNFVDSLADGEYFFSRAHESVTGELEFHQFMESSALSQLLTRVNASSHMKM